MNKRMLLRLNRRDLLQWGGAAMVGGVASLRPTWAFAQDALACTQPKVFDPCSGGSPIEVFPISPLIGGYVDSNGVVRGSAFTQELPIPDPLLPLEALYPAPSKSKQDSLGLGHSHQFFTDDTLPDNTKVAAPLLYHIKLQVAKHKFTSLKALPIDANGNPVIPPEPQTQNAEPRYLPASPIWAFNGRPPFDPEQAAFARTMIYARYGTPALVRFDNELDKNPDSADFGHPQRRFLIHLHNAHTAPESDGNPNAWVCGYAPGEFVDNMYLNWPPGGDDNEKQSFLWFHDHQELHTGANVYKGLVGIYPIFDPKLDPGDERKGPLHLPGLPVRDNDPFARVDYDIPLVLYDCALDDGVTPHKDFHNGCGETHPKAWGQTYFRHFPNHGFVGDVFTVNGVAYPVLRVKRRKYRFRILDASIARLYRLMLVSSTNGPKAAPGRPGQYQLPDAQQCMRFTQIASEGGLLPFPIDRDFIDFSPAKRREVIVDFSRYMDGCPCTKGDCLYLVNVLEMDDGRKADDDLRFDPASFCVPLMKIEIGEYVEDRSEIPYKLRNLPFMDPKARERPEEFRLERGGSAGGEDEWLINGHPFIPHDPLAFVKRGRAEIWTIENGGGGWTHPMHLHQEEHRVLSRNGVPTVAPPSPTIDSAGKVHPALVNGLHVDDLSKEDTIALQPGETVVIYRNFRTFEGRYVAHCHNLAHEDHNMMFGWNIDVV
ncbi:MAG TPA: multicopper oxidase domain-containing protein [Vicinamibacterales bacterium]|nr:multicopper oxidase domain-containing protein [Vicinamibacterales bacterium]